MLIIFSLYLYSILYHDVCIGKDDNNNRLFLENQIQILSLVPVIFEPRHEKSGFGISDQDTR